MLALEGDVVDSERCGIACAVTSRTMLRFGLERGRTIAWPLADAARIAWVELISWLEAGYGFDRWEAYQLLMQAGRMRVGNMVDSKYSKIEKRFWPG